MREKIKDFLDVKKTIRSSRLRMVYALLQMFSVVLAYPIYNALAKREYFWIFSMDIFRCLGSRASIVTITVIIWGILFLTIYPIFAVLDKSRR